MCASLIQRWQHVFSSLSCVTAAFAILYWLLLKHGMGEGIHNLNKLSFSPADFFCEKYLLDIFNYPWIWR